MTRPLVLGLFSGLGFLDRCFEEVGFTVVRGPDLLWGHDVRGWRPPAGVFAGIIAGVPCQHWSPLAHLVRHTHGDAAVAPNMFPELERCVLDAQPDWFLTECARDAPIVAVDGYSIASCLLNNRWIGDGIGQVQNRVRRVCFGVRSPTPSPFDWSPELAILESATTARAVTSRADSVPLRLLADGRPRRILDWSPDIAVLENVQHDRAVIACEGKNGTSPRPDPSGRRQTLPGNLRRRSVARCLELQGWPPDFLDDAPFTAEKKYQLIGNGVPRPMGMAVARTVARAFYPWLLETHRD